MRIPSNRGGIKPSKPIMPPDAIKPALRPLIKIPMMRASPILLKLKSKVCKPSTGAKTSEYTPAPKTLSISTAKPAIYQLN